MNLPNFNDLLNTAVRSNVEILNLNRDMEREERYEQLEEIKSIAESARQQAESLKEISQSAKRQADAATKVSKAANIKANISFILSSLSVIGVLLANADKIVHNVQKILSYLGLLK